MKKKYIILTNNIFSIGGSQIYTRNKMVYLQENDWDVHVFSTLNGSIMIDELKKYESNILSELNYCPHFYSKSVINKVIRTIKDTIGDTNNKEVIIESHTIKLSLWGEILVKILNCKHFVYLLSEEFGNQPNYILDFMNFKHKRHELAGIYEKSLEILFRGYKTIGINENYNLKAVCTNSVDDVDNVIIDRIKKMDINIGSIGRLNKPYVNKMIDEIILFAIKNPLKNIQLVLVGGSVDGIMEKEIHKRTENIKNLAVVIAGRIFPIPRNLFKIIDIFIGVSHSAKLSADEGVLTMSLDVRNSRPIGLLGYETQDLIYNNNESNESISQKLQDILITQRMHINYHSNNKIVKPFDFRSEFFYHMKFIYDSCVDKEYYNTIFNQPRIGDKVCKILIFLCGIRNFQKLTNNKFVVKIIKFSRGKSNEQNS